MVIYVVELTAMMIIDLLIRVSNLKAINIFFPALFDNKFRCTKNTVTVG
jgi:hypothetical protein